VNPNDLLRAVPVTQANADMSDPRQHHAWALGSFPAPNRQMGDVALHPLVVAEFSERLTDFGFRHHPELQTKWLIPGDHPEAGYLNVPKIVDREEYEAWLATQSDPAAAEQSMRAKAEEVLGKVNPRLLERINSMTDEERQAELAEQRAQLPAAFDRLAELRKAIEEDREAQ
jgi:hypothetical protein